MKFLPVAVLLLCLYTTLVYADHTTIEDDQLQDESASTQWFSKCFWRKRLCRRIRIACRPGTRISPGGKCSCARCVPVKKPGGVCSLPKVTGPCKALIRRYYFDKRSGQCKRFIYGGCRGNGNNFKTLQQCKLKCGAGAPNVCTLPKVTGPCRAAFRRYYFDKRSGQCKQFTYGGCRGNGNNFKTLQQCKLKCGAGAPNVCTLPKVTGPCRAAFRRYYFDKRSGQCKKFIYGGCRGNGNNFKTLFQCKLKCSLRRG